MKIAAAFKVVPDDQDITVAGDGSLDSSKAKETVSSYDLNAIEMAAQIACAHDASAVAVTVGGASINDSKLKKNVLARGIDELFMVADDACADLDAHATASVLAAKIEQIGDVDLVVCGDGSADNFAQQVDVQLASALGWPVVTAVSQLEVGEGSATAKRMLEDVVETVEVSLPAVVSIVPEAALPRIPGMKDILAAGKKPMNVETCSEVTNNAVEVLDCRAPEGAERKLVILDAADDGAVVQFADALKSAL